MSWHPEPSPVFPPRPTWLAGALLRDVIRPGDRVIDATAGNGHDTVLLAQCVGPSGRVLAFDIQPAAIDSARSRVTAAGLADQVDFFPCGHERLAEHAAPESVAAVVFNLGYLPGGDHAVTTGCTTTVAALRAAAGVLRGNGTLFVTCYPGHPAGAAEAECVRQELAQWARDGWRTATYLLPHTHRLAPELWLAGKPAKGDRGV